MTGGFQTPLSETPDIGESSPGRLERSRPDAFHRGCLGVGIPEQIVVSYRRFGEPHISSGGSGSLANVAK